jgi:hypothetical protein
MNLIHLILIAMVLLSITGCVDSFAGVDIDASESEADDCYYLQDPENSVLPDSSGQCITINLADDGKMSHL